MKKEHPFLAGILIGGIAGSVLALLFAPKTGKALRSDIKKEYDKYLKKALETNEKLMTNAKSTADYVTIRAEQLFALCKKYAQGAYEGTIEKLEDEIKSIKAGINAAINTYKNKSNGERMPEEFIVDAFSDYDDETLLKHEGMGRRN